MTLRNYVRKVLLLSFREKSSMRKITESSIDYFLRYIIKYDFKFLQKYDIFRIEINRVSFITFFFQYSTSNIYR